MLICSLLFTIELHQPNLMYLLSYNIAMDWRISKRNTIAINPTKDGNLLAGKKIQVIPQMEIESLSIE